MSGADSSGDDLVVGRMNMSEERTILLAIPAKDGYEEDFVLAVGTDHDRVLRNVADGVDAIKATGTEEFDTGEAIGIMPAGNGVVGRGLNGVVGYVHAKPRDKDAEKGVQAGVFGSGGDHHAGAFGRGAIGVVGYSVNTARDTAWEAETPSGICGRAREIGVRGRGGNGGVLGESTGRSWGVKGEGSPGVLGESTDGFGAFCRSRRGPGVCGTSDSHKGGIFESGTSSQIQLVPREVNPPDVQIVKVTPEAYAVVDGASNPLPKTAGSGEIAALKDGQGRCTLWFCVDGDSTPARWAQVLLGPVFGGAA